LDNENSQLRGENLAIKRENESLHVEINKLRLGSELGADRDSAVISEARRSKAQLSSELGKANSRIIELDTMNRVMRDQLDAATEAEASQRRELDREKDRFGFEISRLSDKIAALMAKNDSDVNRIIHLEKEIAEKHDIISRKDRIIREETSKAETFTTRLQELQRGYETEIETLKNDLASEKFTSANNLRKAQREYDDLKREVEERIPMIASTAMQNVENVWLGRLEREKAQLKHAFEAELDKVRRDTLDMQAVAVQNEARNRALVADERAELERLRRNNHRMQRTIEDLETELDNKRRDLRRSGDGVPFGNSYDAALSLYDHGASEPHRDHQFAGAWESARRSINTSRQPPQSQAHRAPFHPTEQQQQPLLQVQQHTLRHQHGNQLFTPLYGPQTSVLHPETMNTLQAQLDSLKQQLSTAFSSAPSVMKGQPTALDSDDIENSLIGVEINGANHPGGEGAHFGVRKADATTVPETLMDTPYVQPRRTRGSTSEDAPKSNRASLQDSTSARQPRSARQGTHGHSGYSSMSSLNDSDNEGELQQEPQQWQHQHQHQHQQQHQQQHHQQVGHVGDTDVLDDVDDNGPISDDDYRMDHNTDLTVNNSGAGASNYRYSRSTPARGNNNTSLPKSTPTPASRDGSSIFGSPAGSSIFETPKSIRKGKTRQQQSDLMSSNRRGEEPSLLNLSNISVASDLKDFSLLDSSLMSAAATTTQLRYGGSTGGRAGFTNTSGIFGGTAGGGFIGGIAMLKEEKLEEMRDGGYHENYWKIKYQR
jgi:hypothetical protein